jgi:hypothetical protein
MTIWTIYNHGTGGSSLKGPDKAEIVNLFGNNDRRAQFRGKLITEGVGSIGDPHKIVFEFKRDQSSGVYSVGKAQDGSANAVTRGIKSGTGGGVQENVDNTVELIRALNLAGHKPEAINMLGWSRGAVTCIRIAWKLFQSQDANMRQIPINIFAVDPVAGAGHSTEVDATTVTPNVRNYFATLATGELRRFFKPIAGHRLHVASVAQTKAWVVPMPGHHSDTAKMDNNIGKLVFNLAYRFLNGCGTPVPAMRHYMLSNLAAWRLYEEVMTGAARVHKTGAVSKFFMGGVGYKRSTEAAAHGFGEAFFPNVHARKLFEAVFPVTYQAYFDPANIDRRNTLAWGQQYSPRLVAEQRQGGLSQGLIDRLAALRPGAAAADATAVPADVALMIGQLQLID